jgi:hypothetical protein
MFVPLLCWVCFTLKSLSNSFRRSSGLFQNKKLHARISRFQCCDNSEQWHSNYKDSRSNSTLSPIFGSPSSALLAVQEALCFDPTDSNVHALKKCVLELQGHMNGYKDAMVHKCWRMARTSYESCLGVYAQEDGNPLLTCSAGELRF